MVILTQINTTNSKDLPVIRHVQGAMQDLTAERKRFARYSYFNVYHFRIDHRTYVFYALDELGLKTPFLAPGDKVELVVQDFDGQHPPADESLVYALRNLEDGMIYISLAIFRFRFSEPYALAILGRTSARHFRRIMAGMLFLIWLLIIGIYFFSGNEMHEDARSINMINIASIFLPAFYFITDLISRFPLWQWKWGRPSRKQRLVEQVYKKMKLGHPLSSTENIIET